MLIKHKVSDEPHYRDSFKKLDLKIEEIAELELKGKDTIKREILCDILHISKDQDKKTAEGLIKESLLPVCEKQNISPYFFKHQLLCNFFHIPIYHKPKIDVFTKFKILEVLVKESPKSMYTNEITKILGEKTGKISNSLCTYRRLDDPWFESIKEEGKQGYKWKVTNEGIEAYNSGEARLLKRKQSNPIPQGTSKRPRRCTAKVFMILDVLVNSPYPLIVASIAATTEMKPMIVQDILKYDQASKLPFFERIQRSGEKRRYRWQASKTGIEYYYTKRKGV